MQNFKNISGVAGKDPMQEDDPSTPSRATKTLLKPSPKKPSVSPLLSSPHRRLVNKVFAESALAAVPDVPYSGDAPQDAP